MNPRRLKNYIVTRTEQVQSFHPVSPSMRTALGKYLGAQNLDSAWMRVAYRSYDGKLRYLTILKSQWIVEEVTAATS